jgi:arylsulfatase A-like enzyme
MIDNERAAVADRLASLEVPLVGDQAKATQITARVHGDKKQMIAVKVNGRKAARDVQLEEGWQTVELQVERGRFVRGENQLVIETRGGKHKVAFAWIRIGSSHPSADEDPLAAAKFDGAADAFDLVNGATLAWYVTIPDGANLVADVSVPCHVEVAGTASDDSLVGGLLGGDVHRIDLSPGSGKVVRLALTARDCPHARVTHPRITLHGPEVQPLAAAPPPKFVILWVMDALRVDKVGVFTPGARAQTPNLDELAKSSAVFRQYYVQGNESQVSHSSMWTGLYPAVHGVRDVDIDKGGTWKLDPKLTLLAQQMADAGYYTTAVTGNGFVNSDGGYSRGFKEFKNPMRDGKVMNDFIPGAKLVDLAIAQLNKHRTEPTYLFLGTIDTHGPWVARKPWIDIYSPGPYHGPFQEFGTAFDLGITPTSMGCAKIPPPDDIERLRAIYDSAVSYHDQQLGRLIAQLKSWGIWDQTMLIVTADHGEELFEDTRCGHGGSLRDSLLRVPLLVHDPSRFPGGTIVDEGAECVDLMPTILSALGRPPVDAAQGDALEPLAQGVARGWPRPSYASMYEYAHAMRIGRWKVRVGPNGVPVIGDLVAEPSELKDLASLRPVETRLLTDHLGMLLALRKQWKKRTWGVVTDVTAEGAAALDEASTP